jgi:hypothetical protein
LEQQAVAGVVVTVEPQVLELPQQVEQRVRAQAQVVTAAQHPHLAAQVAQELPFILAAVVAVLVTVLELL